MRECSGRRGVCGASARRTRTTALRSREVPHVVVLRQVGMLCTAWDAEEWVRGEERRVQRPGLRVGLGRPRGAGPSGSVYSTELGVEGVDRHASKRIHNERAGEGLLQVVRVVRVMGVVLLVLLVLVLLVLVLLVLVLLVLLVLSRGCV
jgi:hypothetical protein